MRVIAKENPYSECDVHVRLDSKEGHASTNRLCRKPESEWMCNRLESLNTEIC